MFAPTIVSAHHDPYYEHHRGNEAEAAIIGGIVGIIIGSAINNDRNDRHYRDRRYERPHRWQHYPRDRRVRCADVQRVDRYGRRYWERICR